MTNQNQHPLYASPPKKEFDIGGKNIAVFNINKVNIDAKTVSAFSNEWEKFDSFTGDEINQVYSMLKACAAFMLGEKDPYPNLLN